MNPYAIDAQGIVIKLMWSYKYSFNGPRTVVKIISDGRKSDADFFSVSVWTAELHSKMQSEDIF